MKNLKLLWLNQNEYPRTNRSSYRRNKMGIIIMFGVCLLIFIVAGIILGGLLEERKKLLNDFAETAKDYNKAAENYSNSLDSLRTTLKGHIKVAENGNNTK